MAQPTAYEQYLLELINAERAGAGAQPLAFDFDLNEAAEGHSQWMIATDTFSHTGSGGSTAGQRMTSAGYAFTGSWTWGENIAWATTRSPTGLVDEVLLLHTNLMNSSGHRANILNGSYREVGLGFEVGDYGGREGAFVTENFARSGSDVFLTGVAFDDQDGDRAYDVGEGLGGLTLTAVSSGGASYTTTTYGSGGYDLALPPATYTVTFSGAGIQSTSMQTTVGSSNVKLDLVDPATGGSPPPPGTIVGTASSETLNGTTGADTIQGLGGNDILNGGDGNDRLEGGAGNDIHHGGRGADTMIGGAGHDSYIVDSASDVVTEGSGEGIDEVYLDNVTMSLFSYVENVTLTNATDGVVGNALDNRISGNAVANYLAGAEGNDTITGGLGADRLVGGSGRDAYVYNAVNEGGDRVLDFSSSDDGFHFKASVFGGLPTGALGSGRFQSSNGDTAATSSVRFFYEEDTRILRYDADGIDSAHAPVTIATLQPGASVSNDDIWMI